MRRVAWWITKNTQCVTSPRGVHTSTVKKSAPAITSSCDFRNGRHDGGRSGLGAMPLTFSAFAG
jgi:hypothetical protein